MKNTKASRELYFLLPSRPSWKEPAQREHPARRSSTPPCVSKKWEGRSSAPLLAAVAAIRPWESFHSMCGGSPGARAPRRLRKPCNSSVVSSPAKPRLPWLSRQDRVSSPRASYLAGGDRSRAPGKSRCAGARECGRPALLDEWSWRKDTQTAEPRDREGGTLPLPGASSRSSEAAAAAALPFSLLCSSRVICAWNAGARFVALVTAPEQTLPLRRRRN